MTSVGTKKEEKQRQRVDRQRSQMKSWPKFEKRSEHIGDERGRARPHQKNGDHMEVSRRERRMAQTARLAGRQFKWLHLHMTLDVKDAFLPMEQPADEEAMIVASDGKYRLRRNFSAKNAAPHASYRDVREVVDPIRKPNALRVAWCGSGQWCDSGYHAEKYMKQKT